MGRFPVAVVISGWRFPWGLCSLDPFGGGSDFVTVVHSNSVEPPFFIYGRDYSRFLGSLNYDVVSNPEPFFFELFPG